MMAPHILRKGNYLSMIHKAVLEMTELPFQRCNFVLSSDDEALLEHQKVP